jgi:hypothetical protein
MQENRSRAVALLGDRGRRARNHHHFDGDDGIVDEQSKCEGVGPGAGCNLCLDLDRVEHMAKPTETKVRTRDGGG